MNPISFYYNMLPEPERSLAMRNAAHRLDKQVRDLQSALIVGFIWGSSPEGYNYWQRIFNSIK